MGGRHLRVPPQVAAALPPRGPKPLPEMAPGIRLRRILGVVSIGVFS